MTESFVRNHGEKQQCFFFFFFFFYITFYIILHLHSNIKPTVTRHTYIDIFIYLGRNNYIKKVKEEEEEEKKKKQQHIFSKK